MSAPKPAARNVPARRVVHDPSASLASRLGDAIVDLLGDVPRTHEASSTGADARARTIALGAAKKAGLAAGTLALPPGPIGWLTIVPELIAIWRIQAQMVADIAGAYGQTASLGREQMLFCLFRHAAAQALRDVAVQVGGRLLTQHASIHLIERAAKQIGVEVSKRLVGRGITRWLPIVGAMGVGAYAYYDTRQIAKTAIALFGANRPKKKRAARPRVPKATRPVLDA